MADITPDQMPDQSRLCVLYLEKTLDIRQYLNWFVLTGDDELTRRALDSSLSIATGKSAASIGVSVLELVDANDKKLPIRECLELAKRGLDWADIVQEIDQLDSTVVKLVPFLYLRRVFERKDAILLAQLVTNTWERRSWEGWLHEVNRLGYAGLNPETIVKLVNNKEGLGWSWEHFGGLIAQGKVTIDELLAVVAKGGNAYWYTFLKERAFFQELSLQQVIELTNLERPDFYAHARWANRYNHESALLRAAEETQKWHDEKNSAS